MNFGAAFAATVALGFMGCKLPPRNPRDVVRPDSPRGNLVGLLIPDPASTGHSNDIPPELCLYGVN